MTPRKNTAQGDPMDRRCTATNRQGKRCGRFAIRGGTVCPFHGGKSPSVKAAAQRREALRQAEADAQAVLAHLSSEALGDPVLELSRVAREILAMKDALAARVNALQSPTYSVLGQERVRVELSLYSEALDRTVKVLDILGRHDLESRRLSMTENDGRLIAWVLQGFLHDIALDADRDAEARVIMRRWLQKMSEAVNAGELPAGA